MSVLPPRGNLTSTLALAARLRGMSDADLRDLIGARAIVSTGIRDFFDLADRLVDSASIQRALVRLDRATLSVVAVVGALDDASATEVAAAMEGSWALGDAQLLLTKAEDLMLVLKDDGRYRAIPAVTEQLELWPTLGLPSPDQLRMDPPPASLDTALSSATHQVDALAAERAFHGVAVIIELLGELTREPGRELSKGGLALPESRRLGTAMLVDPDQVPAILSVAERAGLVARESARWEVTDSADDWLNAPSGVRWGTLAQAWFERLPTEVAEVLAGRAHSAWNALLTDYVSWLYPGGAEWIGNRVGEVIRDAEFLGITAGEVPSGPGMALLAHGVESAVHAMAELFPTEVESVYLQHDLSVVAPGPLRADIDGRFRVLADAESRALASSFRISASSLTRALSSGETAESLLEFLNQVSLTGIPQPLRYLIGETATRYGRIRTGSISQPPGQMEQGMLSYVRSDDHEFLRTVAVDQSLSALGLRQINPHRLVSRFPLDAVFWALSDARYPVIAEDADQEPLHLPRHRVHPAPAVVPVDDSPDLIHRLREASSDAPEETERAWMARQIEVAIRGKAELRVSVELPDGRTVDYLLSPTSLVGGRLRGRDRQADVERTLPLARVVAVLSPE